ncbi:RagB/SusD family nutrient uptake outer membrane protein [Bacteroides sp. 51]|uniref:RagB/SusD family nutrient uptake outer membrane protein n=1 Tax=Bacteroides sp. 51 TaxID=2302938 RepID=UPI0013CFE344|nr:RagB/SusD family nutrient uptake outer membrane protein [Bacteroides sp. 51]NDV81605.1 RagB/SusD family nutrient uptake outer membrane protein [Bacteroides sp. 51]
MKNIFNKTLLGTVAMMLFLSVLTSCSDFLDEKPRGMYEPGYFKTEKGVNGGLTALYAHLRNMYGQPYYYNACQTGTDENTHAQSADANFKDMDYSGVGSLTPTSSRSDVLWGTAYPYINTASGIIENATEVGLSDALIAEARFFRAFDYFMLVQTFGGVPLDLGAGELAFNTSPVRVSTRNTVPEVYTKAIFPDLKTAMTDLPETGRVTGGLTKTVARFYLAKAYLTYGWWLENPNNIPTYPECPRTDPDGHDAQWYFQQAYDMAVTAIENPGPFGLQETYYDVNWAPNDRNNEILLYADHTESNEVYNESQITSGDGGSYMNNAGWMVQWNYTQITSATSTSWDEKINSVQREAEQHLGRPWTRMAPTIGVFEKTFADKTNDSRYDGTFTTVYRANWNKNSSLSGIERAYNANNMIVESGDAILTFLDEEPVTPIDYSNDPYDSNVGVGVLPGRADYVVSPRGISRLNYPGLWKLGTYRTDNGSGLGYPNAGSTRPFNIAKFSELYLIAAEAAVKGATTQSGKSARELVNVLRARAGKWRWDNNGNVEKIQDNSAQMIAATPATITIDYILEERSREYFGEMYRWADLVRTQKWAEIAGTYEICGSDRGDHTAVTVTRNIQPYHYLRPIPQGQIDGMEMTAEEKAAYQNPGYN